MMSQDKKDNAFGPQDVIDRTVISWHNRTVTLLDLRTKYGEEGLAEYNKYMAHHSSFADTHWLKAIFEDQFLNEESYAHRALGSTVVAEKQMKMYKHLLETQDLEMTMILDNIASAYEGMGYMAPAQAIIDTIVVGHPQSQLAKLIGNTMDLSMFSPWGQFGIKAARGPHKRGNLARITHKSVMEMAAQDLEQNRAFGSSMIPYFMTDQNKDMMHTSVMREQYLGQHFNTNVAMGSLPFVGNGSMLWTENKAGLAIMHPGGSMFYTTTNAKVAPGGHSFELMGSRANDVPSSELGVYKDPRRNAIGGGKVWVKHNEYLVFRYKDSNNNYQITTEQFKGPDPAWIAGDHITSSGGNIKVQQQAERTMDTGFRMELGFTNNTLVVNNSVKISRVLDTAKRGAANMIDVFMSMEESHIKHQEHSKFAEMIYGKIFGPLLEAHRYQASRGQSTDVAERTIKSLLGLLNRDTDGNFIDFARFGILGSTAEDAEMARTLALQVGSSRFNAKMAQINISTRLNQDQIRALMKHHINWDTVADLYTTLNNLSTDEKLDIFQNRSHELYENPDEMIAVREELQRWRSKVDTEMARLIQEADTRLDQQQIQHVMDNIDRAKKFGGKIEAMARDRRGLKRLIGQIEQGNLKFREYVLVEAQQGVDALPASINTATDSDPSRFVKALVFAHTHNAGIGIYDGRQGDHVSMIGNIADFPNTGDKEFPNMRRHPSEVNFFDSPSTAIRQRFQNLRLAQSGMNEVGVSLDSQTHIMKFFHKHLARNQYPAVGLGIRDLEIATIGHTFDDATLGEYNVARLNYEGIRYESGRINDSVERVKLDFDRNTAMDIGVRVTIRPEVHYQMGGVGGPISGYISVPAVNVGGGTWEEQRQEAWKFLDQNREVYGLQGVEFDLDDISPEKVLDPEYGKIRRGIYTNATHSERGNPNFLFSMDPIILDFQGMPDHHRNALTLDHDHMRTLMLQEGWSDRDITKMMAITEHYWPGGQSGVTLPAMGRYHPAQTAGNNVNILSRLQHKTMDMMTEFADPALRGEYNAVAIAKARKAMTEYVFEISRDLHRHGIVGQQSTAIFPGIRGLAQNAESNTQLFGNTWDPFNATSRYTKMQTAHISLSTARDSGILADLERVMGDQHRSKFEAIKAGKIGFFGLVQREPHIITTSMIPTLTYLVNDGDHPDQIRPNRSARGSTHQPGGPGQIIVSLTHDGHDRLDGDTDGEHISWIYPGYFEERYSGWRVMQKSLREWHTNQLQGFFEGQKHRLISNIIHGGKAKRGVNNEEVDIWFQRNPDPGPRYGTWREINKFNYADYTDEQSFINLETYHPRGDVDAPNKGWGFLGSQDSITQGKTTHDNIARDGRVAKQLLDRTGMVTESIWFMQSIENTLMEISSPEGVKFMEKMPLGSYAALGELHGLPEEFAQMLIATKYNTGIHGEVVHVGGDLAGKPVGPGSTLLRDHVEARELVTKKSMDRTFFEVIDQLTIAKEVDPELADEAYKHFQRAKDMSINISASERADLFLRLRETGGGAIFKPDTAEALGTLINFFKVMPEHFHTRMKLHHQGLIGSRGLTGLGNLAFMVTEREGEGLQPNLGNEYLFGDMHNQRMYANYQASILNENNSLNSRQSRRLELNYFKERSSVHLPTGFGKWAGLAALAFLAIPAGSIIGDSVGAGGEQYDFYAPNYGLPSNVPLDIPEYTFDARVRTGDFSSMLTQKSKYAQMMQLANQITPSMQTLWDQPGTSPIKVDYRDNRQNPITQMRMKRETDRLEAFRR
jgi:hypothetical protein